MGTNGRFGNFEKKHLYKLWMNTNLVAMEWQQSACRSKSFVPEWFKFLSLKQKYLSPPVKCLQAVLLAKVWEQLGERDERTISAWGSAETEALLCWGPDVHGVVLALLWASCCLHREDHYLCLAEESRDLLWVSDGLEPETQYKGLKVELQLPKPQSHPEQAGGWNTGLVTQLCWSEMAAGGMAVVTFVQLSPSLALFFPSKDREVKRYFQTWFHVSTGYRYNLCSLRTNPMVLHLHWPQQESAGIQTQTRSSFYCAIVWTTSEHTRGKTEEMSSHLKHVLLLRLMSSTHAATLKDIV